MVTKKIGLAGKSGSGKDVISDYISERYGYKKVAVADAIRDEVANFLFELFENTQDTHFRDGPHINPIRDAFTQMVYEKPTPHSIRVLLQWYGTEFRLSQDSNYWVKRLVEKMPEEDFVVVSDVRLPIEMDAIHAAGGEVWFVERQGVDPVGIPGHLTEIGLDGASFDRKIANDKSLEDLHTKVDFIFREC
jgi:hypothetical protein